MNIEDSDQLMAYLLENNWISSSEMIGIQILKGGVSNRTVLLKRAAHADWVIKQAIPKLRVKEDWYCSPARIRSESKGMLWLAEILPEGTVPRLIYEDSTQDLIVMEAIPTPHFNMKKKLLEGSVDPDLFSQMGEILGIVHRRGSGNAEIAEVFEDSSFFEILRLEPYYRFTAKRVARAQTFLLDLCDQTINHPYSIVHGDFSPKNILIFEGKLRLIDHEVIHYGDATFDLGFSLSHFLSKALHLPGSRSDLFKSTKIYFKSYQAQNPPWNKKIEKRTIAHTLGCLLARVHGRSPLEYLTDRECHIQSDLVLEIVETATDQLLSFIDLYHQRLVKRYEN